MARRSTLDRQAQTAPELSVADTAPKDQRTLSDQQRAIEQETTHSGDPARELVTPYHRFSHALAPAQNFMGKFAGNS